jgi:diguanylate cyclase (GGDEF)-like protein
LIILKKINDTYGHHIGDTVLVFLAKKIKNMTRESDVFARVGGEEFAFLLYDTVQEDAIILAEKICATIEQADIPTADGTVRATLSIGVSTLSESISSLEDLYRDADAHLYQAKTLGRNRVA